MQERLPRALVIMAREPVAGRVKTRLCPPLDAGEAAELYERFLVDVIENSWAPKRWDLVVAHQPASAEKAFRELDGGLGIKLIGQTGEGLGARMRGVFEVLLTRYEAVVLRNSDSPQVSPARFEEAFDALESGADAVIAPDGGGGYYLLGMKEVLPEVFDVTMSTADNHRHTLEALAAADRKTTELDAALDVDTGEDLLELGRLLRDDAEAARRCGKTKRWIDQAVAAGRLSL